MDSNLLDQLKSFELLKNVPDLQLNWLINRSVVMEARAGEFIFLPGNPIHSTVFLLTGSYRVYIQTGSQEIDLGKNEKGAITGYLPFSRAKLSTAHGIFLEDSRFIRLNKSFEREMIRHHYERDPSSLETSVPGVFTAGDVGGAMNRVVSAVGEGAMAISFVHRYLAEI